MSQRLDAVEIKVNLTGSQADSAHTVLGLRGDGERQQIYFCDDLTGHTGLPLLDAGVILRVRRTPDGDDVTAKLRPCDRAALVPPRTEMRGEGKYSLRLEEDWTGAHRVLAASLTGSLRVPPDAATATQEGFAAALRRAGLDGDPVQETKTRLVLQRLALDHAIAASA